MIEYIKGTLVSSTPERTIVDVQGIGYKLFIPLSNYSKLPQEGKSICFYVAAVIREDSHKYYGFLSMKERDLFEVLIDVSGIGPKTALSLLGHLQPQDLQLAISSSDVSSICRVPGIGKKTAERLIVDMRDRVQKASPIFAPTVENGGSLQGDAISALVNLGYQPAAAQKTIQSILSEETSPNELSGVITLALKRL